MVMCMYDRAWLNRAAIRVLGWDKSTPNMFGGVIERDAGSNPTGVVVATRASRPGGRVAARPRLSPEDQMLSTRVSSCTSTTASASRASSMPARAGRTTENYQAIAQLAARIQITLRIGYSLFAQTPARSSAATRPGRSS
jgi:predicted amidohydrolase YtcJ